MKTVCILGDARYLLIHGCAKEQLVLFSYDPSHVWDRSSMKGLK